MVEHNNSSMYNDHKGKRKHHDTRANPNKKLKVTCWKCGKPGHLKKDCKGSNVSNKANGSSIKGLEDGSSNPLKGQSMFNKSYHIYYVTYVSETFFVQDDDVAWWVDSGATVHVCKDRCWFKTYELLNDGSILHIGNESTAIVHGRDYVYLRLNIVSIGLAFMSTSKLDDSILWHARLGHVHLKRMQDMSKDGLIPAIDMDTEKCKTCMLTKITKKPFQNVKRETKVLELIHSDLCDLHATLSLGNEMYFVTFIADAFRFCYVYLLHTKDEALDKFKVFKTEVELKQESLIKGFRTDRGDKAAVRLHDPKLKALGKRGIKCIFVGYAEHSKAYRFYVIEPNDSVDINSIIESRDAIFDEHKFSSVPKPSQRSLDDPKTFDEAMKSQVVAFWNKAINDEMDFITGNNTWVLTDLPPGIDYFDTYAPVARISTIRLLIALTSIHNLIIHQMDVKTAFLNRDLEEEVYMNQPLGFIMSGNENKICKLVRSLYGLKQAPRQWHQKFDEVVLSNGYLLNQADNYVCIKFDASGKGVIICLYVDDMLIFGNDQVQVDLTKEFLLSRFFMKDMREADVILGYTDASWINNTEDNSSTSGWVFLLGGGVISWASKKQTCITCSTMESEFVALATAGKEAKWLKNLLLEIPLWVKPMAPISIRCDSAATLAKAYSQMYNGKSRHLGCWYYHQRVDGFSFVTHRVSKLKDTIRGYSIRGSILSGISYNGLF
nr:zinc finger, CCHC-type [Tanacetum cinerariifolium]